MCQPGQPLQSGRSVLSGDAPREACLGEEVSLVCESRKRVGAHLTCGDLIGHERIKALRKGSVGSHCIILLDAIARWVVGNKLVSVPRLKDVVSCHVPAV